MGLWYEAHFIYMGAMRCFSRTEHRPPKTGSDKDPKNIILIVFVAAKIKEIFSLGRRYAWPRPAFCPRCHDTRMWGHGFVPAYFDGFDEGLLLKRYRCPGCGCVVRLRPRGYFPRFQAPIETIRFSLSHRLSRGRWPPGLSPSRQRHWLKALRRTTIAYLGETWRLGLVGAFDCLLLKGTIPVSRGI
jgi:hypothetical protein